jgi:hypothetical protein
VNTSLPRHICDFADVARSRLARLGGPQAALRAEADDQPRRAASDALRDIGAADLDIRNDADDYLAAAVLCRAAGAQALPYPIVEDLVGLDGARFALANPIAPRINHGDLPGEWLVADLDGKTYHADIGERSRAKLGPFLVPATLRELGTAALQSDIDRHLVLGSWLILGAMERCLDITRDHVRSRTQFGKPLAEFQAVRFAVADATVAVRGLEELAKYTISRSASVAPPTATADALVLRLKAVDTAVATLRTCHQLLGALGFCDESDISVIDRHTQPLLRLPCGAEELALRLLPRVRDGHLETLFSEPLYSEPA